MPENYLHECLNQFPDVSEKRWGIGKPFDFKALEGSVEDLRSRRMMIVDIHQRFEQHFKETSDWWFNKFWILPSVDNLSPEEQKKTFSFHQLSKGNEGGPNEGKAIKALLSAFRHIELVSIILRFILPESFGILSPPVQHVLALSSRRDHVETYLNYLDNLRFIRDKYEFESAAKADMALWVLEHKCYFDGMVNPRIKQKFEKDKIMLRLRAKNTVGPIEDLTPAWRAIAFRTIDDNLAALIGCHGLENYVKKLARLEKVEEKAKQLAKDERPTLEPRIKALDAQGKLSFLNLGKEDLDNLSKLRNKVFHGETIFEKDIELLISTVLKLEKKVHSAPS